MLAARIFFGVLFVALLLVLCWFDYHAARPGTYLLPVAVVVGTLSAAELLALLRNRGQMLSQFVVYGCVLLTVLVAGMPIIAPHWSSSAGVHGSGWLAIGLAVAMIIAIVEQLRRFEATGDATIGLALTMFAVMYIGGLTGFLVQLRLLDGGPSGSSGEWGMLALASLLATVKLSDIGQYTFGRLFGRHKLMPKVSPGKTWEGALGGIVFAVIAAWFVFGWFARWLPASKAYSDRFLDSARQPIAVTLFALAVAVAGIIGDLAESMLKRNAGVKDSSTWLPGFGGVLDLLDSLLLAAPVAYVFWAFHWVGP